MEESKEELMSLLIKEKEVSEKVGLKLNIQNKNKNKKKHPTKLNIQKKNIMASGPITSWQIEVETLETVRHFTFLGSKITADGDCSHEIKRLLGRKAMTNLHSILKIRHIALLTNVDLVSYVFFQ